MSLINLNHGFNLATGLPRVVNTFSDRVNGCLDLAGAARALAHKKRDYIGASMVGHPCEREVQLAFCHTPADPARAITGPKQRIFDLGHVIEDLAITWLREADFDLRTEAAAGQQYGFEYLDRKFQGHIDGVLVGGPDVMVYPCLWEHKGLNNESWNETVKKGVKSSKPIYYAQVQLYMMAMGLTANPAHFMATNKNDCKIYHEQIGFDPPVAERMYKRAEDVLAATARRELLPRGFHSKDVCKGHGVFCDFVETCWGMPY